MLTPARSRAVADYSETFGWGSLDPASRQLAVALLLDVTGEPGKALKWCDLFASKYVYNLPSDWTVTEFDVELWLYCFENARPGS